jgi:UDP-N-acetylmuramate--alanine ligase
MTFEEKHFYFIGIGGIGCSGIAKVLLSQGKSVSGSDIGPTAVTDELQRKGAVVRFGHTAENVPHDVDVVVASAAIDESNPELLIAKSRNIPVLKYAQALGLLMKERTGIAVSGTHGKTTTAAMVSFILKNAGSDPAYVIGGNVPQLGGSSYEGAGGFFVAEACEYDRSFLNLHPDYGAILNIEEDHLDYYKGGVREIVAAFRDFVSLFPSDGLLVINEYDRNVVGAAMDAKCTVQTVGIELPADWQASRLEEKDGSFHFDIIRSEKKFGRVRLSVPGMHNVFDAVTAAALAFRASVDRKTILASLSEFKGAQRRFQILGGARGVTFVDDYAHHPTEIQVTLRAARSRFPGRRIVCVFQPHQHSRTRFLLKDFARSFGNADQIYVPDIYFVRESEEERKTINSLDLVGEIVNMGGQARYLPTFEEIKGELRNSLNEGDVLMTMGAGNVFELAYGLLEEFKGNS